MDETLLFGGSKETICSRRSEIRGLLCNCPLPVNLCSLVVSLRSFVHLLTISFNPINFRPHAYFAMSKVKSKIRKAKGRGEEEEEIGAADNNLEEKDLLCCLPEGQGTV